MSSRVDPMCSNSNQATGDLCETKKKTKTFVVCDPRERASRRCAKTKYRPHVFGSIKSIPPQSQQKNGSCQSILDSSGLAVPPYLCCCFASRCCFTIHRNSPSRKPDVVQTLYVMTYIPLTPVLSGRMKTTKPISLERNVISVLTASCCCATCSCGAKGERGL